MEYLDGEPINNDAIGQDVLRAINHIYVEMKLWKDYIRREDIDVVIALYEKYLCSVSESAKKEKGINDVFGGLL
jgi:hypothetical protein